MAMAATINGDLDKPFWTNIHWMDDFVDIAIETSRGFQTKAKMKVEDKFLNVGGWVGVLTCHFFGASSGVFSLNLALALH
jgi:hypothetical protein